MSCSTYKPYKTEKDYDQYSKVELGSSEARIVAQQDVNEVCKALDSDSTLILMPYKLVGATSLCYCTENILRALY